MCLVEVEGWKHRVYICLQWSRVSFRGPGLWMLAAQPFFVLGTAYVMEDRWLGPAKKPWKEKKYLNELLDSTRPCTLNMNDWNNPANTRINPPIHPFEICKNWNTMSNYTILAQFSSNTHRNGKQTIISIHTDRLTSIPRWWLHILNPHHDILIVLIAVKW